jgi:hypothetical protein
MTKTTEEIKDSVCLAKLYSEKQKYDNQKWYSEEELRDKISALTITTNKYGHEGYIHAELLKIVLFIQNGLTKKKK